jgi:putative toxin-antitoxin system antitoxin component (TIGR02293 family)
MPREQARVITQEMIFQWMLFAKSSTVETELELLDQVDNGLHIRLLELMIEEGLLTELEATRFISKRTLERRKSETKLKIEESDLIVRIARVCGYALEIFGTKEKASKWLHTPNKALKDKVPFDLLQTDLGARLVQTILGRIDHGIYS